MCARETTEMAPPFETNSNPKRHSLAAVIDTLDGIEFPAEREDLILRVLRAGPEAIEYQPDTFVSIRAVLEMSKKSQFESMVTISEVIAGSLDNQVA